MGRRKKSGHIEILKAILFLLVALGTAISVAVSFLIKNLPRAISYIKDIGKPSKEPPSTKDIPMSSGNLFLDRALERERNGDYLGARVEYMKCIEDIKQSNQDGSLDEARDLVQKEYDEFVKRDPVYAALISRLLPIIKNRPGILQSEITKHFKKADWWPELTNYNREVTKDDIGYALYFAAKQGIILRTKKGRSYELRVVEDVPVLPASPVK